MSLPPGTVRASPSRGVLYEVKACGRQREKATVTASLTLRTREGLRSRAPVCTSSVAFRRKGALLPLTLSYKLLRFCRPESHYLADSVGTVPRRCIHRGGGRQNKVASFEPCLLGRGRGGSCHVEGSPPALRVVCSDRKFG